MTDSSNAELTERLLADADEIDHFNEHLRKSGTPDDGLQRNWQREAADALAAADGERGILLFNSAGHLKRAEEAESALAQARRDAWLSGATVMREEIANWLQDQEHPARFVAVIRGLDLPEEGRPE